MKLIKWNANGKKGYCSARCYNRTSNSKSRCICQGINKGVGYKQAVINTQNLYLEWIAAKEQQLGIHLSYTLAPVCQYRQMKLWNEEHTVDEYTTSKTS